MPKSAQTIYNEIVAHIQKQGGPPSSWYAGITDNIDRRLHGEHNVPKEGYWFIYREAYSEHDARAVENALHDYGCQGDSGGGDEDTIYVYAYLISRITVE